MSVKPCRLAVLLGAITLIERSTPGQPRARRHGAASPHQHLGCLSVTGQMSLPGCLGTGWLSTSLTPASTLFPVNRSNLNTVWLPGLRLRPKRNPLCFQRSGSQLLFLFVLPLLQFQTPFHCRFNGIMQIFTCCFTTKKTQRGCCQCVNLYKTSQCC